MEDCSKLPKITEALVHRGYNDGDICKILGNNVLRVMEQNERVWRETENHGKAWGTLHCLPYLEKSQ